MRITKQRTLTGLILAVLMALPLCSILSRVIYVQSNKNAYQSYSDVATSTTSKLNDGDTLYDGLMYQFAYTSGTTTTGNTRFDVKNGQTNVVDLYFTGETWTTQYIQFYTEHGNTRLIVYDTNNTSHNKFDWQDVSNSFYLVMEGDKTLPTGTQYFNVYQVSYTYDKLDNVFEYSVSQFVEYNNFGKVDLTSWFMDMFLTDNVHNNLYVHFVNWYLNYVMLITLMHFLFAVLMWFINYCRRLLDRGMNYDW